MNRTILLKLVGIGVLALLLFIPVSMTSQLIQERQAYRHQVVNGIAEGWGGRQTVSGPILVVPYKHYWTELTQEVIDGKARERRIQRSEDGVVRVPFEASDWVADLATSEKARGIHKARLYAVKLRAGGRITVPANFGVGRTSGRALLDERFERGAARVVVGVDDPRGLRSVSVLELSGTRFDFAPGTFDAVAARGVHAPVDKLDVTTERTHAFSFSLELAGSETFALAPIARDTSLTMNADWPHPSFFGPFLPTRHDIRDNGFTATWRVSQFAAQGASRIEQCGSRGKAAKDCPIVQETLGVSFIEPVGVYQQLDRTTKYGFLFIGLLFASFFLLELLKQLAIHPIQYTLVGLALAIFFLLLTALSEHIAFHFAYLIATIACVGIVTAYVVRALKSFGLGCLFGAGLAALYGALYMLLMAEDYALLAGALLLFGLLAAVMIGTRRVDWYQYTKAPSRVTPAPAS